MSKSPALRRIQADIRELSIDPSDRYHAHPLENDMFEWHFTIRGADGTDFEGGYYHGRILLPAEYPFKPPNIVFLTPSGRFEINTKVCLSFSAYHPELWQPAWGIRLILEALVSFLPTKGDGAIGALDWTSEERRRLAKKSVDYVCPVCGKCSDILKRIEKKVAAKKGSGCIMTKPSRFQKEIEQLQVLQRANHEVEKKEEDDDENGDEEKPAKDEVEKKDENGGDTDFSGSAKAKDVSDGSKVDVTNESVAENINASDNISAIVTDENSDENVEAATATEISVEENEDLKKNGDDGDNDIDGGSETTDKAVVTSKENVAAAATSDQLDEQKANDTEAVEIDAGEESNKSEPNSNLSEANDLTDASNDVNANTIAETHEYADSDEIVTEAENTAAADTDTDERLQSPLLSDPVVHAGIIIFSIIVWLLVRKLNAIIADMKALEAEFQKLK